uniref:Ubiquitin-like 7a (bone marrow stromal cell-derived) n=1 Tax=Eptatretus burgeri TaxID=7764 RepID=A0A8C4N3D0_EPTBU
MAGLAVKLADRLNSACLLFPDLGPDISVSSAKETIAKKIDLAPDQVIDLVYCGRQMKDDQSLASYGVVYGSTIHVLKKTLPEPESIAELVDKVEAYRALRLLQAAIATSPVHRDAVFKILGNKESVNQHIFATPGLSSDPVGMGVLQNKDLFVLFADPNLLDRLSTSHPALLNCMVLLLHSVVESSPFPIPSAVPRHHASSASYDIPGGFSFDGLSDEEDDEQPRVALATTPPRPDTLRYAGLSGPRPITQSELASALAMASTPGSSGNTPTSGIQASTSGASIRPDLFTQALQQALQGGTLPPAQHQWQQQLKQLHDMGIQDAELSLRALQATGGDLQAALELIFAGMAP